MSMASITEKGTPLNFTYSQFLKIFGEKKKPLLARAWLCMYICLFVFFQICAAAVHIL